MNIVTILCNDFWMKTHLIKTWEKIADNVFNFFYPGMAQWHKGGWLKTRSQEGEKLINWLNDIISNHKIDLIFCVGYDDFFTPQLCKSIKRHNIPLVNYHPDSDTQWYRCLRSASYFDLIGVAYKDYIDRLAQLTKVIYLPMAANCDEYFPQETNKLFDVMFVGAYTLERERVMSAVTEVTSNVIVYGQRWDRSIPIKERVTRRFPIEKYLNDLRYYLLPRIRAEGIERIFKRRQIESDIYFKPYEGKIGGYLSDDNFVSEINRAKIVIGINQRFGSIGSKNGSVNSRLRDFEIPACGVLYMGQRYPELESYYQEGQDIEMWSSLEELKEKIANYLNNHSKLEAISQQGRIKVLQEHTWEHRFIRILQELNIQYPLTTH
jgi:spore maturation protein CgeB